MEVWKIRREENKKVIDWDQVEAKTIGIELTQEEKNILKLPPKFSILDKLDKEEMELQIETANAKLRYNRADDNENIDNKMTREDIKEEEKGRYDEDDEKSKKEIMRMDAESTEVYNRVTKTVNVTKLRSTNVTNNKKVVLPKSLHPIREAEIQIRKNAFMKDFEDYTKDNCDEYNNQESNLTSRDRRGIKKLKERIKKKEIVFTPSDKTGSLIAMEMGEYIRMGTEFTNKDKKINDHEIEENQRKLKAHASAWGKILKAGEQWGHEERIRRNNINHGKSIAPVYFMPKDHKVYKEGELIKGRPVCSATRGMGTQLASMLSTIMRPLAENAPGSIEVISTEDMLGRVDKVNDKLSSAHPSSTRTTEVLTRDEMKPEQPSQRIKGTDETTTHKTQNKSKSEMCTEELVIVGCDAVNLYPSLSVRKLKDTIINQVNKSPVKFDDINYDDCLIYLANICQPHEFVRWGIHSFMPRRKSK